MDGRLGLSASVRKLFCFPWQAYRQNHWSRVWFPGSSNLADSTTWFRDFRFWLLVMSAGLLFFSRLKSPLLEPDEARYAEIPRQMLAEGRWLVPYLHGQPYYHKPPLLYWLVMACYRVFGVHDWAARLVPCSAGWLVVLVTFCWGKRTVGSRAAFAGAMILALSGRFVYLGRMLTMDTLLCLWVVLGWMMGHLAMQTTVFRKHWWILSAIVCGLGLLTKGPVALVLVALPVLVWQFLDERTSRPRILPWLFFGGIAWGVAAPWYGAMALCEPAFINDFFWTHNFVRYVAPHDHPGPAWFYLPGLLLGMMPWTLLFPSMVRFFRRRSAVAARRRPAGMGFFLLAFGWCLVFYSLAGCKRPGYILPAMPALALSLGSYLDAAWPRKGFHFLKTEHLNRLAYWATAIMLVAGIGASLVAVGADIVKPASGFILAGLAAGGLSWLFFRGPGRHLGVSWSICGGTTWVVLLLALHQIQPGYIRKFSLRSQILPQQKWAHDPLVPVICYPHRWDSVSFYLGRNDVREYAIEDRKTFLADLDKRTKTLVFVKTNDAQGNILRSFLHQLPADLEFIPMSKPGAVTAGMVIRRAEIPPTVFARR